MSGVGSHLDSAHCRHFDASDAATPSGLRDFMKIFRSAHSCCRLGTPRRVGRIVSSSLWRLNKARRAIRYAAGQTSRTTWMFEVLSPTAKPPAVALGRRRSVRGLFGTVQHESVALAAFEARCVDSNAGCGFFTALYIPQRDATVASSHQTVYYPSAENTLLAVSGPATAVRYPWVAATLSAKSGRNVNPVLALPLSSKAPLHSTRSMLLAFAVINLSTIDFWILMFDVVAAAFFQSVLIIVTIYCCRQVQDMVRSRCGAEYRGRSPKTAGVPRRTVVLQSTMVGTCETLSHVAKPSTYPAENVKCHCHCHCH